MWLKLVCIEEVDVVESMRFKGEGNEKWDGKTG